MAKNPGSRNKNEKPIGFLGREMSKSYGALDKFLGKYIEFHQNQKTTLGTLVDITEDKYGSYLILKDYSKVKYKHFKKYNITIPWKYIEKNTIPVYFNPREQMHVENTSKKKIERFHEYFNNQTMKDALISEKNFREHLSPKPGFFKRLEIAYNIMIGK
ncbi:MAG: hypothetical protein AABX80_01235 [Nanoarchaeota archaeon]